MQLAEEDVKLPEDLTDRLHGDLCEFYVSTATWSSATKILLIKLGFYHLLTRLNIRLIDGRILCAQSLFTLADYLALTRHSQENASIYRTQLLDSMNAPEKMKTFLDYFPSTDLVNLVLGSKKLGEHRQHFTIFDRLLKMELSYYETNDQHVRLADVPNFTSDQQSTRPANMLYLLQMLICKGAKVSCRIDDVCSST